MADHRIGDGDITLKIDGEDMVLKPSWGAAQQISSRFGGIQAAVEKVIRLDVDATIQIVLLGLGFVGTRKPPADLAERIWKTGLTDASGGVAEACVKYLHVLAAGGRKPPEEAAGDAEANPSTKPSTSDS